MKEKNVFKKRLLSLLLSFALAVSMLPLTPMTAFAADPISTGNVTIMPPIVGKTLSYTVISDEPDKYTATVRFWTDKSDPTGTYLDKSVIVEAGKQYSVAIQLTAVEPYTLSEDYNSNFKINGNASGFTGSATCRTTIFSSITAYTLTYDANGGSGTMEDTIIMEDSAFSLPACEFSAPAGKEFQCWEIDGTRYNVSDSYTATGDVTVKAVWGGLTKGNANVIAPVAEMSPSFTVTSDEPEKYTATVLQWLDTADNTPLTTSDTFEEGKEYTVQVRFTETAPYTLSTKNNFTINGNATTAFDDGLTRTYTFTAADASTHSHDCDTATWLCDSTSHWNPCKTDGCHARLNEAAHNSNEKSGAIAATLENDGKTDNSYCSICHQKTADGTAIPSLKYIRTSAVTMAPAVLTSRICANDLTFTSADASKYTVSLWRVFDLTDSSMNTDYGQYPKQQLFMDGHTYAIEFSFAAVAPYVYEEVTEGYTSTFTLNGSSTEPSSSSALSASPDRRITLTVGSTPSHTHNYNQYIVDTQYLKSPATCTNAAVYFKSCSCGEQSSSETFSYGNPLGHNFVTVIDRAATTTQTGQKHEECSICKLTQNTTVIPKLTPSNPSNPSNPTTPSNPSNPADPTTPSNPSNPANPTTPSNPTSSVKPAKVGTKFKDSKGASYKVTSAKVKNPTVSYTAPKKKAKGSVKIPASVTYKGVTYKVTSIAANVLKNNKKVTSIEIGKNINSISAKAFYNCKNLKKITVKTTKLTKKNVGKNSFKGIHKKAVIKVPKKKLNAYKKLFNSKGIGKKVVIKKI